MKRCIIVGCTRLRTEGSDMCEPHRWYCYRFLSDPRWRIEQPPPLRRDGTMQLPLEVRDA